DVYKRQRLGLGEASPDPEVTGETQPQVIAALQRAAPFLMGQSPFDLEPILAALAAQPPSHLLVFAPDGLSWPVAYHTQLAFAPYRPYFAHGLVLDNTTDYANFWAQPLPDTVDYAVLPRDLAGLDYGRIGEKVAQAPAFVLYRVSPEGVPYLLELARGWRAQEAAEPPFPSLAP
ncbi:MAG: hypothetical protein N2383_16340, partial [Caldilineales bacterium]|nr:hypothetical protein [Caldilineales bacterium]